MYYVVHARAGGGQPSSAGAVFGLRFRSSLLGLMFCWKRAGIVLIFMILDAFSSSFAFVSLIICGISMAFTAEPTRAIPRVQGCASETVGLPQKRSS
jgi:hypothetical protein